MNPTFQLPSFLNFPIIFLLIILGKHQAFSAITSHLGDSKFSEISYLNEKEIRNRMLNHPQFFSSINSNTVLKMSENVTVENKNIT